RSRRRRPRRTTAKPPAPDLCAGGVLRVRIRRAWEKVIPTVPFDLIFSVLVGLVFAACARQQFTGGAAPWGRELAAIMTFEAIVLWPVALYYYMVYPEWCWMSFVAARRLPGGVGILVLLAHAASPLGAYRRRWALPPARTQ